MTHCICTGDCGGVAEKSGTCQAQDCQNHGETLEECNCTDGQHNGHTEEGAVEEEEE